MDTIDLYSLEYGETSVQNDQRRKRPGICRSQMAAPSEWPIKGEAMGTKRIDTNGDLQGIYGTLAECNYISKLGKHTGPGQKEVHYKVRKFSKLQLLKKCYSNLLRRANWGSIDSGKVIAHCLDLIAYEQKKKPLRS